MMAHRTARLSTIALFLAPGLSSAAEAQETQSGGAARPPAAVTSSDLGFLELGRTYEIKFPDEFHPVLKRESGVSPAEAAPQKRESGAAAAPLSPASWSARFEVNLFVVRKLGGGSWVLLEHPVDPKKYFESMSSRHLLSDKAKVAGMEATKEGRQALARLREKAGVAPKTTQSWINLVHAISITDPPDSSGDRKLDIQVQAVSPTGAGR
jgi:hypothetical protein